MDEDLVHHDLKESGLTSAKSCRNSEPTSTSPKSAVLDEARYEPLKSKRARAPARLARLAIRINAPSSARRTSERRDHGTLALSSASGSCRSTRWPSHCAGRRPGRAVCGGERPVPAVALSVSRVGFDRESLAFEAEMTGCEQEIGRIRDPAPPCQPS